MKAFKFLLLIGICLPNVLKSQDSSTFRSKYYQLVEGSENSGRYQVMLGSDIDTTWYRWDHRGYSFGFDKRKTPMYTHIDGIISTSYMVQVRGNTEERNRKRWGYHVFEGYAQDDKSRITLLVNKHEEEGKPLRKCITMALFITIHPRLTTG